MPDLECVEEVLRSIPEVRDVKYWTREGGRPLTWSGIQRADRAHYFRYELDNVSPTLLVVVDYKGRVELSQHLLSMGSPLPPGSIEEARPVMQKIEQALAEHCGTGTLDVRE